MTATEWVITAGAVVAALSAIFYFAFKTYRVIHRIDSVLGVDRQGRTISDRLERVEHHLFPNGGSSLTDKINVIEFEQREMKGQLDAVETILAGHVRRSDGPAGTPKGL
jgi:hypothetical protein